MYGYTGKILKVNLSDREISSEPLNQEFAKSFLGGGGFAAKLMEIEGMDWSIDPFDPKSLLIFSLGPLTGAPAPFCSRYVVSAKSPLTNLWGEAHASGYWGPELKFAGWDAIVIDGQSERPVYLWIHDDTAEICDARDIWGKDTYETEAFLQKTLERKNVRVASIGQAGEKRSRIASIMNDHGRAAARSGMGGVMGSKNLKAIAVCGTGKPKLAKPEEFKKYVKELTQIIMKAPAREALRKYGTDGGMMAFHEMGDVPIKNWRVGKWEEGCYEVSGYSMTEKILTDIYTCRMCPIGCGRVVEVKEGPYAMSGKGPEYETVAGFGPLCLNDKIEVVAKANDLSNRFGIDTISTSMVIAFAMECFEKGLITRKDTDGIDLTWGNGDAIIEIVKKMGKREGFGEILADGSFYAAKRIGKGSEDFAIHVKGQELALHDPRAFFSWAVAYATAHRGACHILAPTYWLERGLTFPELGYDKPLDRFASEGKGTWVKIFQDFFEVLESLVMCKFSLYANLRGNHILKLLNLTTGWGMNLKEMVQIGERGFNLKRMNNVRLGVTSIDDTLPKRLLTESLPEGGAKGRIPPLETMLKEYYLARGWDESGIPTQAKLEELVLGYMRR
jgi:aldehyde:ferredoxin oxidoreductase